MKTLTLALFAASLYAQVPLAYTTMPSPCGTASTTAIHLIGSGSTQKALTNICQPDGTWKEIVTTDQTVQLPLTGTAMLRSDGSGGVTAATAGTDYPTVASVTTAQTAATSAATSAAAHAANTNNPHAVTVAQLGGLPTSGSGVLCFDSATKLLTIGCVTSTGNQISYALGGWSSQTNNSSDSTRGVFATSTDGVNFSLVSSAPGIVGPKGYLRDTTLIHTSNGTWGAAGTCDGSDFNSPGPCLFVASSLLGLYSSTATRIQPTNANNDVNANVTYSWAPEFFKDNEGCTGASGNDVWGIPCTGAEAYYMYYSASNNADGGRILAIKFTDASLTSWTNLAGTSGVATVVYSANHVYDPSLVTFYNSGSGLKTYVMFCVSNGGGLPEKNIQYMTSTTLGGTFTLASTGDWTHRFNNHDAGPTVDQNTYEGPNFVRTGATTARIYFDYVGPVGVQSQGVYYIEASNIDFTNPASLSTATWAAGVKLAGPGAAGTLGDHWRHLTVERLVNVTP